MPVEASGKIEFKQAICTAPDGAPDKQMISSTGTGEWPSSSWTMSSASSPFTSSDCGS